MNATALAGDRRIDGTALDRGRQVNATALDAPGA